VFVHTPCYISCDTARHPYTRPPRVLYCTVPQLSRSRTRRNKHCNHGTWMTSGPSPPNSSKIGTSRYYAWWSSDSLSASQYTVGLDGWRQKAQNIESQIRRPPGIIVAFIRQKYPPGMQLDVVLEKRARMGMNRYVGTVERPS
jgi:hypothetical protein